MDTETYSEMKCKYLLRLIFCCLANGCNCLVQLLDISPQIVARCVQLGAVDGLASVITHCMETIGESMAENMMIIRECIKALRMISLEDPTRVLKSNCLEVIFNFINFDEDNITRKYVFEIVHNISRAAATEEEFRATLLPIIPFITEQLRQTGTEELKERGEKLSTVLLSITEHFRTFLHPIENFEKISALFEELHNNGTISMMIDSLGEFAQWKQ